MLLFYLYPLDTTWDLRTQRLLLFKKPLTTPKSLKETNTIVTVSGDPHIKETGMPSQGHAKVVNCKF